MVVSTTNCKRRSDCPRAHLSLDAPVPRLQSKRENKLKLDLSPYLPHSSRFEHKRLSLGRAGSAGLASAPPYTAKVPGAASTVHECHGAHPSAATYLQPIVTINDSSRWRRPTAGQRCDGGHDCAFRCGLRAQAALAYARVTDPHL